MEAGGHHRIVAAAAASSQGGGWLSGCECQGVRTARSKEAVVAAATVFVMGGGGAQAVGGSPAVGGGSGGTMSCCNSFVGNGRRATGLSTVTCCVCTTLSLVTARCWMAGHAACWPPDMVYGLILGSEEPGSSNGELLTWPNIGCAQCGRSAVQGVI